MALAVNVTNIDSTQNSFIVEFTITPTGNYGGGATHGDTLSFAGTGPRIPANRPPTFVEIDEQPAAGTSATGYLYSYSPGSTRDNGVMQIFETGAALSGPLAEYTEGAAYSAGILAAVIKGRATFRSL